jgi:phosphatidylserine/phosphatidylglycerophosphate/cardiolipin synthase-like enzyme
LTHQKTIVVDNSRALILTLNLTEQYYASSRDFGVIDRNAADVAAIVKTFNADYTDQKITAPDGADLVWSPGSLAPTLSLINSAHKSLCIYNEEMDDATVVDALVRAAQRGVNVRVVMTSSSSWTANFKRLVAAGVHVRTYAASASLYIHAKMILVDGVRVFLGSENFSASSLDDNRELGLIITQPSIISDLTQVFDGDYAHAQAFSN